MSNEAKIYRVTNGLKKGYIAVLNADGSYKECVQLGDLIEFSVAISENTTKLSAGNFTILTDTALGEISVSISIPEVSDDIKCLIFGHKKGSMGEIVQTANDIKPYVALCVERTMKNSSSGQEISEFVTLYKGQFNQIEKKAKTKEDGTVEFQTDSMSGTFMPLQTDNNMYMSSVKSDAEGFNAETFKFGVEIVKPTAA